ncbi:MAG: hypothetical protein SCK29_14865, partial [Bacillota bacterium]|nr:hypothetical protein [Bacillota bacterium]
VAQFFTGVTGSIFFWRVAHFFIDNRTLRSSKMRNPSSLSDRKKQKVAILEIATHKAIWPSDLRFLSCFTLLKHTVI